MVKNQEIEFLSGGEVKAVGSALSDLQRALEKTAKGILQAGKQSAKTTRSVAGFDNLERLPAQNSAGEKSSASAGDITLAAQEISNILTAAVGTFSAVVEEKLQAFATWNGGGITDGLTGIMAAVGALQALLSGDKSLSTWLSGISGAFSSAGQAVSNFGGLLAGFLSPTLGGIAGIMGSVTDGGLALNGVCDSLGLSALSLGGTLGKLTSPMGLVRGAASALAGGIRTLIKDWGGVGTVATTVWGSIQAVWGKVAGWFQKQVFAPLGNYLRLLADVAIGVVNTLLMIFVGVINAVIKTLNLLSFKVPDWVPGLGGKRFGFQLKTVETPQIPYLAQGAVLPANKPFLAMVGDQKHGTNVEAPLATIQQAVAEVMGEQTGAILSGFEASIGVQKEILEAVLGIHIGDSTIAQAVRRYENKLSVIRGGSL